MGNHPSYCSKKLVFSRFATIEMTIDARASPLPHLPLLVISTFTSQQVNGQEIEQIQVIFSKQFHLNYNLIGRRPDSFLDISTEVRHYQQGSKEQWHYNPYLYILNNDRIVIWLWLCNLVEVMRDQSESCEGVWMFHAANDVEKQLLMKASLKPECRDGLVA